MYSTKIEKSVDLRINDRIKVWTHSPAEVIGGVVKSISSDPEADVQSVCLRQIAEIGLNQSRARRMSDVNGFRVSAGCGVFSHRVGFTIRHRLPLSVTPNPAAVHWIWHPLWHLTTNIHRRHDMRSAQGWNITSTENKNLFNSHKSL